MLIYLITNTVNGKTYVGQTIHTLEYRWRQHISAAGRDPSRDKTANYRLPRAMRKYGIDAFKIEEIDRAASRSGLDMLEMHHIARLNSASPRLGYNMMVGGNSPNEETRAKMIANHVGNTGRKFTAEHIAKITANFKGKTGWPKGSKHADETKAKYSADRAGKKCSAEHCAAISKSHMGNKYGVGNKNNLGKHTPHGPMSAAHKAALSAAKKGKLQGPLSVAHKAAISAGLRARYRPGELEA